jgi:hypothetical protein
MVHLWNLSPTDVIVLSSKRSGGYDDGGGGNNECVVIPPPTLELTVGLRRYFQTQHQVWNADYLLYHAVNRSLDRTIEMIGRDRIEETVRLIRHLQTIAEARCYGEAVFPCSPIGTFQPDLAATSCYVQDAGCGHDCVQRVLQGRGIDNGGGGGGGGGRHPKHTPKGNRDGRAL